jgi:hypothetical protein
MRAVQGRDNTGPSAQKDCGIPLSSFASQMPPSPKGKVFCLAEIIKFLGL